MKTSNAGFRALALFMFLVASPVAPHLQAQTNTNIPLGEALDIGGLIWNAYGNATPAWSGQSSVSHDGVDAAQSGPVGNSGFVTVQTAVLGPGRISFWWKVSSEPGNDKLVFSINGSEKARISGEVEWQLRTLPITSSFSNTLQWTYSKNAGGAAGLDRGWLDQVRFLPGTGCVVNLAQASVMHSRNSETGQVSVTAATTCTWAVDNTNSWITPLTEVAQGDGDFRYIVAAANSAASRSGVVLIGGQPFTIVQQGAPDCVTTLSETSATHSWISETGQVSVTTATGCAWAVDNTNSWITPLPGVAEGNGDFRYSVAAANSAASRSGVVVIGGQPFTIIQQGAPCTLSIAPAGQTFDFPGGGGSINVTTPIGCPWSVENTNGWVTITNASGSGSGRINYLVAANTNSFSRSGNIRVGDQLHFIHQEVTIDEALDTAGTPLAWSASRWKAQPGVTHDGVDAAQSFGIPGIVGVESILELHVPGPGTLTFWWKVSSGIYDLRLYVYGGLEATIQGEVDWQQRTVTIPPDVPFGYYTVKWVYQSDFDGPWSNAAWVDQVQFVPASSPTNPPPPGCTISFSPIHRAHSSGSATNTVAVTTQNDCAWSVIASNSWISILSSLNNSNSGTVTYSVASNTNAHPRNGSILIGGKWFFLTQFGITNAPRLQLMSQTPTNTTLAVEGHQGKMYVLEFSDDLIHWTPISTNSSTSTFTDATTNAPRRFYRTVEIP